jgi:hypothetical protein
LHLRSRGYTFHFMTKYYNPVRSRNVYDPGRSEPYKLSRSRLERFIECPRCFYLDRRLGIDRPPGFPFTLNSAVDQLLKKEFDKFRERGVAHPLIKKYGVDAIPIPHEKLDVWRANFKGIEYLHRPTNFIITGAIDDLWQNRRGEYIVVDYKATAKAEKVDALEEEWHEAYKRQMEVYQWLLRQNGLLVSNTGYFVYCNGDTAKETFDAKLEFELTLIAHEGNDSWVEDTIVAAHKCLNGGQIPDPSPDCDYCGYVTAAAGVRSS